MRPSITISVNVASPLGVGHTWASQDAGYILTSARKRLATLIGAADPSHIAFTCSGTMSLNLALQGILRDGDHIIATDGEHNSVIRPLDSCRGSGELRSIGFPAMRLDALMRVRSPVDSRRKRAWSACTHASNVTGAVQPIEQIGEIVARSEHFPR